ncbi:MbtH family protein [Micromonospora lupini]|uniref:Protein mbtH n=1 Tax=Micromonospora lupini str. Lupac 08 TaxID=1150864 RepID=I0L9R5_9ACTN|nr:MbtH family NRPS accessory protein [Micromonospora lupini]CCH20562.1 Protein mbtH [Micromonospora lupini str. Lupac 08]
MTNETDELSYSVVVNHEEQYSIWPAERPVPAGWRAEGTTGSREECLDHVERVWVDMRPASLRRHLDGEPDDVA